MNILFAGQAIPYEILNNPKFSMARKLNDTAGNNFYVHLLTGMAQNGHTVESMCRVTDDIVKEYGKKIVSESVTYRFNKKRKNFLFNHLMLFPSTFFRIRKWAKKYKEDSMVIVNCLRITQCLAAIVAKKIYGIKLVAVVTDVPKYRVIDTNKSLISKLSDMLGSYMLSKYDKYILLSEDMNPIVNSGSKPYVVIEGLIDPKIFSGIHEDKHKDFTVMYAGALARKYNIMSVVDAVINTECNIKFLIYGSGELDQELTEISKSNPKIEYKGSVPYSEILKQETKAHLLINPRSTEEEYTKLSFPSKNIEYMLSGTACLFTKLKSMPEEYYSYIFTIEDESSEGIQKKLEEIYQLSPDRLEKLGLSAREYIINNKSRSTQAKKIVG